MSGFQTERNGAEAFTTPSYGVLVDHWPGAFVGTLPFWPSFGRPWATRRGRLPEAITNGFIQNEDEERGRSGSASHRTTPKRQKKKSSPYPEHAAQPRRRKAHSEKRPSTGRPRGVFNPKRSCPQRTGGEQGSGGHRDLEDEEAREEVLVRLEGQTAAQDVRAERAIRAAEPPQVFLPVEPIAAAAHSAMDPATAARRRRRAGQSGAGGGSLVLAWLALLSVTRLPAAAGDCWLIEGEKGFVWLAICSMNQPPYEAIPAHINSTVVDLRLNENKIRSVHYSSLSRFGNLTYLNLTKNDIAYVEDGAFSAQFNLQVLQMGFNKLRNLTEGMLRGLGKLQYLYLQANLIESVAPNTFWECPGIENVDLSMNRIQVLDGTLFSGLSKLTTCELYANPFNCSCELLPFLRWFAAFPNRTGDRMVCEAPRGFSGYNLLTASGRRDALHVLGQVCGEDGGNSTGLLAEGPPDAASAPPPPPDFSPCGLDDCASGTPPDEVIYRTVLADINPVMTLKRVLRSSAVITVEIPQPYRKMYILMLYNNSFFTDIGTLKYQRQDVELSDLKADTDYTYCVASVRNSLRFNHTCLTISTGRGARPERTAERPSATRYIVTVLGGLLGMLLFLGLAVHCLRRRRTAGEKERQLSRVRRTPAQLEYGDGDETESAGGPPSPPRGVDPYRPREAAETPARQPAELSYVEVRGSGADRQREISPRAEISTIAKEVDKVNQIINNCIDALKSESTSFQQSAAEPQPPLLSPVYRHSLRRHHSTEAPAGSKRPSAPSSPGSARSPRSLRSEGGCRASESGYIERGSPGGDEEVVRAVNPAAAILRAEARRIRQYREHRHSYPGPRELHPRELRYHPGGRQPSVPDPLALAEQRELAYSRLAPHYHNLSYCSSPEDDDDDEEEEEEGLLCTPTLGLWERFKLHRKRHRQASTEDEGYVAAGHALRRKVQFAKDEDLHDILDYWKGVSAQQKA
ncbi:protein ELFN1-like [Hippocampus zosterae]|uniref:protein ELFN1-like n=1 Tax=Hippocampus zosterae TaxID=109293 RepID=UPI00223E3C8F|nr:protein ELFN1-like [Hippocampus zosterae]